MPAALKALASGQITTQVVTITGGPTGGTWTPYVGGVSAGAVAYNASAATLQTALRTVNNSITVTGDASGYTITSPAGSGAIVTMQTNGLTGGTAPNVVLTGTDTTVYTVPNAKAVKVATASLTNTSNYPVTVSVAVVPSGQSVDVTRRVVADYVLAGKDTIRLTEIEGSMLEAGAVVAVNANGAAAINYLLTGAEVS